MFDSFILFFENIAIEWLMGWKTLSPLFVGILFQLIIIGIIYFLFKLFKKTKFILMFELFFEQMYEFFEEILGLKEKKRVKSYIISLFMIILLINISSWILDWIRIIFVKNGVFDITLFDKFILIPTTQFEFNIALAIVSIVISLYVQIKHLGVLKFAHAYIPLGGKGILDVERGNMNVFIYYPVKIIVKIFDICISLFVGLLDVVGIFAKIVSLSARLFGNMISGGILLGLLVVAVGGFTTELFGLNFPVAVPLILFAQGLLVAVIQALVFPLLSAIFIKIGQE